MLKLLRLPPDYAQVLRELRDTAENPFYWRERRRDARRGEPFRNLINTASTLCLVFGVAWVGLWLLLSLGTFPDGRVPAWLGGQDGGRAIFAVVAGAHALIIFYTSRNIVNRIIAGEASRGTLFQLLMTRVPAFEMLVQLTLYPFQLAMVAAVAGLPFYMLIMSMNSVGIHEVFVLYLLFALLAIGVPKWRSPAFGEQSPEEMSQMLREQGKAAGCLAFLMVCIILPATMMIGGYVAALHYVSPNIASRVPIDVWPALIAFPVTGTWVIVRLLTASYTWFGLPLPLWTWILPILFLTRLRAVWLSSLFLRVAYIQQIPHLPDARGEAAFGRLLFRFTLIGILGAVWQPLMETNLPSRLFWPGNPPGVDHNLAGMLYLTGAVGVVWAAIRLRYALVHQRDLRSHGSARWKWILTPLWPSIVGLLAALAVWPNAVFTIPVTWAVLCVGSVGAAFLMLVAACRNADASPIIAVAVLPAVAGLAPAPFHWVASISPLTAWIAFSEAARNTSLSGSIYHLAPGWAGLIGPWIGVGAVYALRSAGMLKHGSSSARTMTLPAHRNGPTPVANPVAPPVYASATPPVIAAPSMHSVGAATAGEVTLDFVVDGVDLNAPPVAPAMPVPPLAAPPVVASPFRNTTYSTFGNGAGGPAHPPTAVPNRPVERRPVAAPVQPSAPPMDWRSRPVSPAAASALRWLYQRTDNPVAIYSARRVLPGTLNTDQLIITIAFGLLGILVAAYIPVLLLAFVLPWMFNPLLFHQPSLLADESAVGFTYLITGLAVTACFAPLIACANVTRAFRMEREHSTLGFVLMTPLSSFQLAVGHMIGAAIPSIALWLGASSIGAIAVGVLAAKGYAGAGLWGWSVGFGTSLLFLILSVITGAWIGITEHKAHDMTIGVYMLPISMCGLALAASFYFWFNRAWTFEACTIVFLALVIVQTMLLWKSALSELQKLRHGDVPFEGRVAAG